MELFTVHLGLELGLYRALDDASTNPSDGGSTGGLTEGELAARAGISPRYAREWLEHQVVSGFITCDEPSSPAADRIYRLAARARRGVVGRGQSVPHRTGRDDARRYSAGASVAPGRVSHRRRRALRRVRRRDPRRHPSTEPAGVHPRPRVDLARLDAGRDRKTRRAIRRHAYSISAVAKARRHLRSRRRTRESALSASTWTRGRLPPPKRRPRVSAWAIE